MEPFDDWLAHDMKGSGDLPEATFLALAGNDVVGYAKFSFTAARPTVAAHDMTGVKRASRLRNRSRTQVRPDLMGDPARPATLETTNEERNAPIRRLNQQLGYRTAPGRILLQGATSAS